MRFKSYKQIFFIAVMFLLLFITSCSCVGNTQPKTSFAADETDKNLIEWVNTKIDEGVSTEGKTEQQILDEKKTFAKELIQNYINDDVIAKKKKNQYQVDIIRNYDIPLYLGLIDKATISNHTDTSTESKWVKAATYVRNCTGASNVDSTNLIKDIEANNGEELNLNDIVCSFALKVEERTVNLESEPIVFYTGKAFWSHLFNNLLVFPMAWLMVQLSNLFGGFYIIGLLITTILVRTIAWPIYAKTNDMTLKMQLMQPELNKIQEKYATRQDDRSKQMMQMEMAQLYKKYKVGLSGCLMPFLQFPIFMAIYRAVSRIPYTIAYEGTIYKNDWANEINPRFLGINLFEDRTAGTGQFIGIIILVVVVIGTQFLSQWISQRRQKKNQQESQADIPAYRRQSYEQTKGGAQTSMKMMMYMMMLMMGLFVFKSKAGLGIYWCIGNLYSMAQMAINSKTNAKRMEKLRKKL